MKYITSIWTTAILFIGLLSLRVIDLPLVEQLRLNSFDSYIRTMHERESSK